MPNDNKRCQTITNCATIDRDELREMLGCSGRTLWRRVRDGDVPEPLPHHKGSPRRWRYDEIQAWFRRDCPHWRDWRKVRSQAIDDWRRAQAEILAGNGVATTTPRKGRINDD